MLENKRTINDLHQMQSLPLSVKIKMTESRIRNWIDEYGEDGVYISFSGGKDSTVLVDIIDKMLPHNNIPLVYINTGLEFPEIVNFVKSYGERVTIIKPKMNFKQVIMRYGYPFFSKEVAQQINEATTTKGEKTYRKRMGLIEGNKSGVLPQKYRFAVNGKYLFGHKCCYVMKKQPAHIYERKTGRKPITGQQASESKLRTQQWIRNGCNSFGGGELKAK